MTPCWSGWYNPLPNQWISAACLPCPPGLYCEKFCPTGLPPSNQPGFNYPPYNYPWQGPQTPGWPGYNCTGASTPQPCPYGALCLDGVVVAFDLSKVIPIIERPITTP